VEGLFSQLFSTDERFIMHRYRSTRLAMVVGVVMMVLWFNYELIVNQNLRWDLAIILGAMVVTKLAAMLYYRATN
jgi:low affinity Fe/Cu permease